MKRMPEKDIPAFVQEVAATGCDICAVGPGYYVMGDANVPRAASVGAVQEVR
ncbi:hypothetical protein [Mesorhizobium caraganae]|uniref:hypothetical protein n=1 Tax=Mesorhizobium caraganae TaxID=483206 RepID=UPI001FE2DFAB|nr:hypothetical protein [Mesorhizobium caraganae]